MSNPGQSELIRTLIGWGVAQPTSALPGVGRADSTDLRLSATKTPRPRYPLLTGPGALSSILRTSADPGGATKRNQAGVIGARKISETGSGEHLRLSVGICGYLRASARKINFKDSPASLGHQRPASECIRPHLTTSEVFSH